ncbi:tRNA lysidine(34) synthetase TilS [Bifidobacterium aemilianum]|uniref:tRNA(Ile)-lysidine synthase n=1 Tax=Bifidobacterium aemilianum TaxID=2493120 RepID=A0A366K6K6_9BIFI|nr:tRNA lysidine(34) synthetase TilS [Bifidobacterium aemilianum]RBP97380.1 tRNA lysidine(34) synthetase TilS [Bifidobacterium aemilianum]
MAYSSRLRTAIGDLKSCLKSQGLGLQDPAFAQHGSHEPLPDAPLVLVACSGGRDSMALAALTSTVCASLGLRAGTLIVDHGLQEGSAQVADQCAQHCRSLGLDPVQLLTVRVAQAGSGLEASARQARYQALVQAAKAKTADLVLLAHTKSDQAETVLMDLMHSSGLDSITGMPASFRLDGVSFARPFLRLTREETTGICSDLGLEWWDDPSNGDGADAGHPLPVDYPLRSRIRHDLLPYMEDFFGGDLTSHLAHSASLAAQDQEYLEQQAQELMVRLVGFEPLASVAQSPTTSPNSAKLTTAAPTSAGPQAASIQARGLAAQHPAMRRRVIAKTMLALGLPVLSRHVEAIDQLIANWHGQGPIHLPSGYSAARQKHVIHLCKYR